MASSLKLSPSTTPFFLLLFFLLTAIPFSYGAPAQEKEAHLHLYFHEINSGPNSTAVVVASLNKSSSTFGDFIVFDDTLREGPEPTSKLIGRAQGIVPEVSQEEITYLVAANFVFTEGEYNGSTIAVFGQAVFESSTREWSIVGGTGQFRLARGYALGKKLSSPAGTLIIEFDVYVLHY